VPFGLSASLISFSEMEKKSFDCDCKWWVAICKKAVYFLLEKRHFSWAILLGQWSALLSHFVWLVGSNLDMIN